MTRFVSLSIFSLFYIVLSITWWQGWSFDHNTFSRNQRRNIDHVKRGVISAVIGCAMMQSSPASATLSSLSGIAGAAEAVDYILKNMDEKQNEKQSKEDISKLFDDVDFIIKRYNLRDRLQIAIAETPAEYSACAAPRAASVMSDLYTLVEYYSVSNDSINRRMMISDAVPGEKLKFLRTGLSAVGQDLRGFFFCYPSELK